MLVVENRPAIVSKKTLGNQDRIEMDVFQSGSRGVEYLVRQLLSSHPTNGFKQLAVIRLKLESAESKGFIRSRLSRSRWKKAVARSRPSCCCDL